MSVDREIMVVNRDILFEKIYFDGFLDPQEFNFESVILDNYEWMEQGPAERNYLFKQPIGYAILCNPSLEIVFIYQRSSLDEHYSEKRLQGKYSCGVGGHVEKLDVSNTNPINASTLREVNEEVEITVSDNPKVIGYINVDSDDVGKVHFGILYLIETNSEVVMPKNPEIANGKLIHINEFEEICNDPDYAVEGWTKIALESLKKYLDNNG